jgi:hypothetical protein
MVYVKTSILEKQNALIFGSSDYEETYKWGALTGWKRGTS